ncbi:MAG: transcription elongation factor GreA [Anaerolineaceae bacterium]|nr:transcription elongation factor GreA [Anaerolineaceae bacterium]
MATSFLTQEGYEKLQEELDYLRNEKRSEIAERLREAMEGGDLIDNAEYEAAKREQAFTEGRIKELQFLFATARVIDKTAKSSDLVDIGSTVTIKEKGSEEEVYMIVGPAEANPREGRISNESPFGKALLGQKVGQKVKIDAPEGSFEIKILKVE